MGDKIDRPNFLQLDGFTFSFNMTDHLNPLIPQAESLTAICETVSRYHQLVFPNWTRLLANFRIIRITAENELFQYLDTYSQQTYLNWLIFSRVDVHIYVTHFGPFGRMKDRDFGKKVKQTQRSLKKLKDIWLSSSSLPVKQKEARQKRIMKDIKKDFAAMMQDVEEQIEAKKNELKEAVENVFDSEEIRERIIMQITKITIKSEVGKTVMTALVKEITAETAKVVAKVAAKQTAKQGAKAVSRGAAKATAKSIPFVGLAVGTGFAIWRLVNGDVAGAGLEIASGAASTVPGAGTAASLAIDAGLLVKDVNDARKLSMEHFENLKAVSERIEREVNDLFTDYENAKVEYDFVCEVLGDPGYDFEKLEHDIKVVDEVLGELDNN